MPAEPHMPFRCAYPGCGKIFNRRDYLERHATNHLVVKPFVCHECNRSFSRKDLYDNHLLTKRHLRLIQEAADNAQQRKVLPLPANDASANWTLPQSNQVPVAASSHIQAPKSSLNPIASFSTHGSFAEGQFASTQSMFMDPEEPQSTVYPHNASNFLSSLDHAQSLAASTPLNLQMTERGPSEAFPPVWGLSATPADAALQFRKRRHATDSGDDEAAAGYKLRPRTSYSLHIPDTKTPYSHTTAGMTSNAKKFSATQKIVQDRLDQDATRNAQYVDFLRKSNRESDASDYSSTTKSRSESTSTHSAADELQSFPSLSAPDWPLSRPAVQSEVPALSTDSENLSRGDYDQRYRWFFDDRFPNEGSKYGYDLLYSEAVQTYRDRAEKWARRNAQQIHQHTKTRLHPSNAEAVLNILKDIPDHFYNHLGSVEKYISAAWTDISAVKWVVHEESYDPNRAHPALLAVLTILGMAISSDEEIMNVAKSAYPSVFLYTYETLGTDSASTRYDISQIGHLQAFSLLLRYEPTILGKDTAKLSLTRYKTGRHIIDRYLWIVLGSVPHLNNGHDDAHGGQCFAKPSRKSVYGTVSQEGYMLHQGADAEQQWREWASFEACKRTVHFAVYCDSIQTLSFTNYSNSPVSIFNMDIHMVCPDELWCARSAEEFFDVTGPSRVVVNVPFLGLIKSLIRFPRVSMPASCSTDVRDVNGELWSLFALRMVAYGLMTIVGRLSGLFTNGETILEMLVEHSSTVPHNAAADNSQPQLSMSPNTHPWVSPNFDQQIQARLFRGLDIWFKSFENAHGTVTEWLFQVGRKGALNQSQVSSPLRGLSDHESSQHVPEYAFIVVLFHYSSFIVVHEDIPIILQVTSNLPKWLSVPEGSPQISLRTLLDYLYMPLFTQWFQTEEANAMVSTSALFLTWLKVASSQPKLGVLSDHLFLLAVSYIAVIVVWLRDLAECDGKVNYKPLDLSNGLGYIDDAMSYLHSVNTNVTESKPLPKQRALPATVLLTASLIYGHGSAQPLVEMLTKLLQVMEPTLSAEDIYKTLQETSSAYHNARAGKLQGTVSIPSDSAQIARSPNSHSNQFNSPVISERDESDDAGIFVSP